MSWIENNEMIVSALQTTFSETGILEDIHFDEESQKIRMRCPSHIKLNGEPSKPRLSYGAEVPETELISALNCEIQSIRLSYLLSQERSNIRFAKTVDYMDNKIVFADRVILKYCQESEASLPIQDFFDENIQRVNARDLIAKWRSFDTKEFVGALHEFDTPNEPSYYSPSKTKLLML